MRINEHYSKIKNEVENRRDYTKSEKYKTPKSERLEFARFVAQIYFKPNEQYPRGGYTLKPSWEQLKLDELGHLDEWTSFKTLLAFIYKLKKQDKLKKAKIYMSTETLPLLKDKKHKELVCIITDYIDIVNKSLVFHFAESNHIINLTNFRREWLE
jgi:hypothetical protein|tara:strand:+ start:418 stop:885 length:468 start_codon:yes stop_codon:yes gene_type:complete